MALDPSTINNLNLPGGGTMLNRVIFDPEPPKIFKIDFNITIGELAGPSDRPAGSFDTPDRTEGWA